MAEGANDNVKPATYDMLRKGRDWMVYNTRTLELVRVDGVLQIEMEMEKADDLVGLLNSSRVSAS